MLVMVVQRRDGRRSPAWFLCAARSARTTPRSKRSSSASCSVLCLLLGFELNNLNEVPVTYVIYRQLGEFWQVSRRWARPWALPRQIKRCES